MLCATGGRSADRITGVNVGVLVIVAVFVTVAVFFGVAVLPNPQQSVFVAVGKVPVGVRVLLGVDVGVEVFVEVLVTVGVAVIVGV